MKILFIITLLYVSLVGVSQEIPETKKHQVGGHLGATTGIGISYRYWPSKLGVQFTFVPVIYESNTFISLGLTGLFTLGETRYLKPFLYLGNHYVISENTAEYNIGFGPGLSVGSVVRFNLMIGYGFYDVLYTFNLFPTAEIGVYYKF
jgi:hypothetical protein